MSSSPRLDPVSLDDYDLREPLEHEERLVALPAVPEQAAHVGAGHAGEHDRLAGHPLPELARAARRPVEELDGDGRPGAPVDGLEDAARRLAAMGFDEVGVDPLWTSLDKASEILRAVRDALPS